MADEKTNVTETATTETATAKKGILGTIITIIVSVLVGAGAMFGLDATVLQKTHGGIFLVKYNTEVTTSTIQDVFAEEGIFGDLLTDAKKAEITEKIVAKNTAVEAMAKFFDTACAATKAEIKADVKADEAKVEEKVDEAVKEVKDAVEGTAEAAAPAADAVTTVTENAAEAAPAVKKD